MRGEEVPDEEALDGVEEEETYVAEGAAARFGGWAAAIIGAEGGSREWVYAAAADPTSGRRASVSGRGEKGDFENDE